MKVKNRLSKAIIASVAVITVASLTGCAQGSTAADGDETTTVQVGIAPYFEYQPWIVADKLGLDEEQGIDLQFTNFAGTDKAVIAAYRGDVDIAANCLACSLPLMEQVPELEDWMITNQFKGFIVIGRTGKTETFAQLSESAGEEEAKEAILESMKGKSFAMRSASYKALVIAALDQVGLTIDDIKIIDFQSDSQAALAYAGGTGDFYIGSLPEEAKLLSEPEKYVNVGGTEVLGDAGLWFSSMAAKGSWLEENTETTDKLLAIWYRTMRYMAEEPDSTLPLFADAINEAAASKLPLSEITTITTELERFATLDQAEAEFYNPSSPTYYKKSLDFYVEGNKDVLPADYDPEASVTAPKFFEEGLLANAELVDWVNNPLK
jgi:ABC-type nitrate/sulfonate/bicarbonate transport system substrate-binding protein